MDMNNKEFIIDFNKNKEKYDQILYDYISSLSKPLSEWRNNLSPDKFKKTYLNFWLKETKFKNGNNYFKYTNDKEITNHFENHFKKNNFTDEDLFIIDSKKPYFFRLCHVNDQYSITKPGPTRDIRTFYEDFIKQGVLTYKIDVTHLDGFNSEVMSYGQEIQISLDNDLCIFEKTY